jgi:hypothetical protein
MRSTRILCSAAFAVFVGGCHSSSDTGGGDASEPPAGDAGSPTPDATVSSTDAALSDAMSSDGMAAVDAALDGSPPPTLTIADPGDAGILGITVAPLTLVPSFSPSITDYYVRCAASSNAISVSVTDSTGTQTTPVDVVPDQEISVAGQYWIRCLPPDFPPITVTRPTADSGPTPGWYLVNNGTYGIVLDTNGTPVWYTRGPGVSNVDSVATDTISYVPNAVGAFGTDASEHFEIHDLDTLTTTDLFAVGSPTDAHEFQLLPNGDHLIFTYPVIDNVDLTSLGSFANGLSTIVDCEVQEISPSGSLVWSWSGYQHINVSESVEATKATVNGVNLIDVYHCNSIAVDATGNLLVSSRYANALFYIDKATGTVLWKLGGLAPNKDGAQVIEVIGDIQGTFNMQHDGRFQPNGDISLFDDHGRFPDSGLARGIEYAIDFDASTASVAFEFFGIATSNREGSFRRYADGHSVVGWGYIATDPRVVTEVDSNGNDVLDIAFGGTESYRAVKVPVSDLNVAVLRATTAR